MDTSLLTPPPYFSTGTTIFDWNGWSIEGRWEESQKPVSSSEEWYGKSAFLSKVKEVEKEVKQTTVKEFSYTFRGKSMFVSSVIFRDHRQKFEWSQSYVDDYIHKKNVFPTKRFFEYIRDYTLVRRRIDTKCMIS
jgi:hypothetical protein